MNVMNVLAKYTAGIVLIYFSVYPAVFVRAQQASGSISGYITCGDGNFPARGATVELISVARLLSGASGSSTANSARTITDFSGWYEIWTVASGTYIVNVTFDGYSDNLKLVRPVLGLYSVDDQKGMLAALPQATIKPGDSARKDLVLRRGASISGRVAVDLGGTAGKTLVTASLVSGSLVGASTNESKAKSVPYSQSGFTDDRGYYRIAGLPPGRYRLSAVLKESFFGTRLNGGETIDLEPLRSGVAQLTVFAPEALEKAAAKLIDVQDGDEITDADISVPTRFLHSIGGTVTQGGAPTGGIDVSVQRPDGSVQEYETISMPDGFYQFDLLPAGTYTVRAKAMGPSDLGAKFLLGQVSIQLIDTDVLDANIDLRTRPNQKQ
jgi:Carboxypeptidase regulatory-like domain